MPRETLNNLNRHLDNIAGVDENLQAQFDALKEHVQRGIDDEAHHPTLLDELEEAVIQFGDDHPGLASALRSAINILSRGGV
jgi:hypothetical protein